MAIVPPDMLPTPIINEVKPIGAKYLMPNNTLVNAPSMYDGNKYSGVCFFQGAIAQYLEVMFDRGVDYIDCFGANSNHSKPVSVSVNGVIAWPDITKLFTKTPSMIRFAISKPTGAFTLRFDSPPDVSVFAISEIKGFYVS